MEVGPTRSRLSRELRFRDRRNEPTLLCKIWFFRREKFDSPVEKSSGSNAITRGAPSSNGRILSWQRACSLQRAGGCVPLRQSAGPLHRYWSRIDVIWDRAEIEARRLHRATEIQIWFRRGHMRHRNGRCGPRSGPEFSVRRGHVRGRLPTRPRRKICHSSFTLSGKATLQTGPISD
jgi:hypothetical protein